jgi:hypothetical protein
VYRLPDPGGKQTHLPDSLQCFVLINDIQRALAPQPAGVHGFKKVIGHGSLGFQVLMLYTPHWIKMQMALSRGARPT